MQNFFDRRDFLKTTGAATAALFASRALFAADERPYPRLRTAVKFGMIRINGSVQDKFELVKKLGFEGVELNSPAEIDKDEVLRARDKTGIVIHGVIDSIHWNVRLSDPSADVRAKGVAALETALQDAKVYGATTVLLVPGKVTDPQNENYEQVYSRSQEAIRKVIPLAEELKVKIAIETVWNDFITKPEQLVQYVDDFKNPIVGAYFDISNMIKYGVAPAQWIRLLGPRMVKFDFKGYSHAKKWVDIGEGDEDWPEVLKALAEVKYDGWATSEVRGGGESELREIANRMNRVLGLKSKA